MRMRMRFPGDQSVSSLLHAIILRDGLPIIIGKSLVCVCGGEDSSRFILK